MEEGISRKIQEVAKAHYNCRHGESWRLINDITGRKTSVKGQLAGNTQKERVQNWYYHFKSSRTHRTLGDEAEDVTSVLEDLDINPRPTKPFLEHGLPRGGWLPPP